MIAVTRVYMGMHLRLTLQWQLPLRGRHECIGEPDSPGVLWCCHARHSVPWRCLTHHR